MKYKINALGCIEDIEFISSPNFDKRPSNMPIDMLVIHCISLPPANYESNGIIELFTNMINPNDNEYYQDLKGLHVSAHFVIRRDGRLIQFVPCSRRAWHCGQSEWLGRIKCNDFSIGIELEGTDSTAFEDIQYLTLYELSKALIKKYPIKHIVGHSDIAPKRKTDPGIAFNWKEFQTVLNQSHLQFASHASHNTTV